MKKKIFLVDLDYTLCIPNLDVEDPYTRYGLAIPKIEMINKVNELYNLGHIIKLYTARGMISCNEDLNLIEKLVGNITRTWLKDNNVNYHHLIFGKQYGNYFIDDTLITFDDFLNRNINEF